MDIPAWVKNPPYKVEDRTDRWIAPRSRSGWPKDMCLPVSGLPVGWVLNPRGTPVLIFARHAGIMKPGLTSSQHACEERGAM